MRELFACYEVKCPKGTSLSHAVDDQFGSRVVTTKKATLLCAPGQPAMMGS